MEQQTLILLITISLLISNANAGVCTQAGVGTCCRLSGNDAQGFGVQTCATQATDGQDMFATACHQGYYLDGTSPNLTCTPCAAGQDAGNATDGSTATVCTDCPANSFCPIVVYGSTNVAPTSCPTGTTSAAGSDALNDCICTDTTKTLDTTSNTAGCVSTYTGAGGNCRTFAVATPGTCTLCRDGYYVASNICSACATNCKVCSSGTVCTTANDGYYINANAPVACAANCKVCTSGTACTTGKDGYFVSGGAPTACAANCKVCTSASACTTGNDGYFVTGGAPTACAANCKVCTSATACTTGKDGFFVTGGAPTACAANCKVCTSATACTQANAGYYLQAAAPVACPANTTRCTSADGTTIVVTGVLANFYVQTGATNVATACTAGTSSAATADGVSATAVADNAAGCTIACSPNCVSCTTNGAAQCDVCQDEFAYDATTMLCTAITDANRHPSCATARGLTAADCLTCRDADNRSLVKAAETDVTGMCKCQATFTESGQTDATKFPTLAERSACVACGKGVATCQTATDATPLAPLTCTVATNLITGNICAASTDKVDGVYYDATEKQFLVCDATCSTCANKGAGFCLTCQDLPAATPSQGDVETLLKAWSNGTLPATGGTCYGKCPTGYEVQDDTRVNCVMESSSQIISMIAIFISFIYFI